MRTILRGWNAPGLVLLALLVPVLAAPDKKKPAPPPPVAKLAWLTGNWRYELNGRVVDEQWMTPGGGVMLGQTRTVVKGRMTEHGVLQIRGGPGGAIYYVTRPAGQEEALYQATSVAEGAVVFANPEREFPRTISYTLKADSTLSAVQEGVEPDGQTRRTETIYQRFQP